jgi:hypothetical protein
VSVGSSSRAPVIIFVPGAAGVVEHNLALSSTSLARAVELGPIHLSHSRLLEFDFRVQFSRCKSI